VRQNRPHLLFCVDNLDDHRQIHGQPKDLRGVDSTGSAEAHRAAKDGCAGQLELARFKHDRLVERLVLPTIAFTNEDAEQSGFLGKLHGCA
jgi:hypothetical protein